MAKEALYIAETHKKPIEGPLDERWSRFLLQILNVINGQEKLLYTSAHELFNYIQEKQTALTQHNKNVKLIFLTRQGVPIYWLLRGLYDAKGVTMPDYDVLGISAGYRTSQVDYRAEDEEALRDILGISEETHGIFIDDMMSAGRTISACFNLVEKLRGSRDNYSWKVLFDNEVCAPWDLMHLSAFDYKIAAKDWQRFSPARREYYDREYFSVHLFNSPQTPANAGFAEPPELNPYHSSQIAAYFIAAHLYDIGSQRMGGFQTIC